MQSIHQIAAATGAWKSPPSYYLPIYEEMFEKIRVLPLALLELGIYQGGSLRAWEAYFPRARIAGVDLTLPSIDLGPRVRMFAGDQADPALLSGIAAEIAPEGFDIIIDDCSHIGKLAKASFRHLFGPHLKPGGLYCIEDWGTGYLPDWPDGRPPAAEPDTDRRMPSHDAGMVGFIKQLIDELGADACAGGPTRFASMTINAGLCIIRKAGPPPRPAISPTKPAAAVAIGQFLSRLTGAAQGS